MPARANHCIEWFIKTSGIPIIKERKYLIQTVLYNAPAINDIIITILETLIFKSSIIPIKIKEIEPAT